MKRPVFSIICVYNDEEVLKGWLLAGLQDQPPCFELIKVDNTGGAFRSAAAALNHGAARANGEYLLFVHQDVRLMAGDWLEQAASFLGKLPDLGIAGVGGMRGLPAAEILSVLGTSASLRGTGQVFSGPGKIPALGDVQFTQPVAVQTLDELLLIIPDEMYSSAPFDENTCRDWHLYGVDYSLSVAARGLKAYVLPLPVWHRSGGTLSCGYFRTLKAIFKKHHGYKIIPTTCGFWSAYNFLNCLNLLVLAFRSEIGKRIGRPNAGAGRYLRHIKSLLAPGRGNQHD